MTAPMTTPIEISTATVVKGCEKTVKLIMTSHTHNTCLFTTGTSVPPGEELFGCLTLSTYDHTSSQVTITQNIYQLTFSACELKLTSMLLGSVCLIRIFMKFKMRGLLTLENSVRWPLPQMPSALQPLQKKDNWYIIFIVIN